MGSHLLSPVVTSFQIFRNFATSYNLGKVDTSIMSVVTSFQIFRNFATSYNLPNKLLLGILVVTSFQIFRNFATSYNKRALFPMWDARCDKLSNFS